MNDIWSLLGIDPTDDKKAIRKAFAAQSRLHHPEEEPEYFAALNQAYKTALDYGMRTEQETKYETVFPENAIKEFKDSDDISRKIQRETSLLKLLDQAAEQAIKKSMEAGALHDFIALFENPKQAKQADTWKRFFLSDVFLKEQFSEEFGKGLFTYLSKQNLCPSDNLPMGLLQELAVAYAFIPHFAGEEYFDGLKYPKEWYKVSVENTFPGRRYAAEIFNMQGRECDLKSMTNRILRQPAIKVRHNAFSDYLTMKEMSRDGRLTDGEKEIWQHILGVCQPFYLYERNGKQIGSGSYEARSECVVKLYVQWLMDEQLPEEVQRAGTQQYQRTLQRFEGGSFTPPSPGGGDFVRRGWKGTANHKTLQNLFCHHQRQPEQLRQIYLRRNTGNQGTGESLFCTAGMGTAKGGKGPV